MGSLNRRGFLAGLLGLVATPFLPKAAPEVVALRTVRITPEAARLAYGVGIAETQTTSWKVLARQKFGEAWGRRWNAAALGHLTRAQ